jgi:hypothetical protein
VLANNDKPLSTAVERSLFYLSHYDFATIEQDVLSNIYGQFLDTSQHKRLGEHYTPPDIARYIVRPNLPFTDRRLVGQRKNLTASDRYQKAYRTRRGFDSLHPLAYQFKPIESILP